MEKNNLEQRCIKYLALGYNSNHLGEFKKRHEVYVMAKCYDCDGKDKKCKDYEVKK